MTKAGRDHLAGHVNGTAVLGSDKLEIVHNVTVAYQDLRRMASR